MTATFMRRAPPALGGDGFALVAGPDLFGHADAALEDAARGADQRGAAQQLVPAGEIHVEVDDDHALRMLDPDHALRRLRQGRDLRGHRSGYRARRGDAYGAGHRVRLVTG